MKAVISKGREVKESGTYNKEKRERDREVEGASSVIQIIPEVPEVMNSGGIGIIPQIVFPVASSYSICSSSSQ